MPVGRVWLYNGSAGFGIIQPEGGGNDAFVHVTAVTTARLDGLERGQRLRYVLRTDARGQTCAHDLTPE
ncbi:cold-shock protein [Sphingomonas sp. DT-204]|uniref:cold-shock protein n=1 Tax=Sphingomonas sp. DT-204 TaxID=3396166 RepID=UPI003F1A1D60